jgi:hypothetical protein
VSGGLEKTATLRSFGGVDYVAAEREGSPVVAVVSDAPFLEAVARAHERIVHPRVPRLAGTGEIDGHPAVLLAFEAACDLESLLERARVRRPSVHPRGAAAFVVETLEMLRAANAAGEPLGFLSTANVLVGPRGDLAFLGFGHPTRASERAALFTRMPRAFAAPELAFGGAPSAGGDVAAVALFLQSFLELGDLPPMLSEAALGRGELVPLVAELMQTSSAVSPSERSLDRYLELVRQALDVVGIVPNAGDLAADLVLLLNEHATELVIASDAAWFRLGGRTVQLEHHTTIRRVLLALARRRIERPGAPSPWEDVFAQAWPGERAKPAAAKARVQVAVSTLRKLGLREAIVTRDDGYLVDAAIDVTLAPS